MKFARIAAVLAALFGCSVAQAQTSGSVTNHAFAVGKGAGVTGYTSLLCTSAQLAVGQSAADPICQTITGDVTISAGGVTAIGSSIVHNSMLNSDVFSASVTLTNKTINCANNTCTVRLGSDVTGNLPLSNLVTGSLDQVIGYFGATAANAIAINNCTGALTYSTTTHTFGCNAAAGTGTVTSATLNAAGLNVASGTCTITTSGTCLHTVTAAVKSDQTTASSTSVAIVPGVQQFHPSAVKAWALWTGTTTGTNAPTSGYNVTSIQRVSAGVYTVTFTTAFASASSYACTSSAASGTSTAGIAAGPYAATPTTTAYSVGTFNFAGTPTDYAFVQIHCSGTQ